MLLRVNGPVLGRNTGDLIEVSDEEGQAIVAEYQHWVTEVAERAPRPASRPPRASASVQRSAGRRSAARAAGPQTEPAAEAENTEPVADAAESVEVEPVAAEGAVDEPTVEEVLASLEPGDVVS